MNRNSTLSNSLPSTEKQPPLTGTPTVPPSLPCSYAPSHDPKGNPRNILSIDAYSISSAFQTGDPHLMLISTLCSGLLMYDDDPTGNHPSMTHNCKIN